MSTRAASSSHVPNGEAGHTGGLRRSALLLAAALVVTYQGRRAGAAGDGRGARDAGFPTLGSPAAGRDALVSLFGIAAERIRFGWADATLPVDGRKASEPVLDGDWLLDSDAVVARNDWRFTVSASQDELAAWAAQGLVVVTEDRRPVPAPHLLARLREAVPLWHGVVLTFEVERASDVLILGRSASSPPGTTVVHGSGQFFTREPAPP